MILAWLTANQHAQKYQHGGLEGGDKPGAQLLGFEQATTKNILKVCKYT